MTDEEFVMWFGKTIEYFERQAKEKEIKYIKNEKQFKKLENAVKFLQGLIDRNGGELCPVDIDSCWNCAGISAYINSFSLNGEEEVKTFREVLDGITAFGIDPTTDDRVYIDMTVPNVYEEMDN